MDFLKWWWWHVLDNDNREAILFALWVVGTVVVVIFFIFSHGLFWPWMLCIDWFWIMVALFWYFSKQHKAYQEKEGEEDEES